MYACRSCTCLPACLWYMRTACPPACLRYGICVSYSMVYACSPGIPVPGKGLTCAVVYPCSHVLACLPACMPACLLACLPACLLPACPHACLPACRLPACVVTAGLPATCMLLTCMSACMSVRARVTSECICVPACTHLARPQCQLIYSDVISSPLRKNLARNLALGTPHPGPWILRLPAWWQRLDLRHRVLA